MPASAPTAAPPSFYDSLPAGGDAAAGNMSPAKKPMEDGHEEILKGATGMYRVASKMAKVNESLKPFVDKIKQDIKILVVQGLKADPSALESGEEKPPEETPAAPPSGRETASPQNSDETHAA